MLGAALVKLARTGTVGSVGTMTFFVTLFFRSTVAASETGGEGSLETSYVKTYSVSLSPTVLRMPEGMEIVSELANRYCSTADGQFPPPLAADSWHDHLCTHGYVAAAVGEIMGSEYVLLSSRALPGGSDEGPKTVGSAMES